MLRDVSRLADIAGIEGRNHSFTLNPHKGVAKPPVAFDFGLTKLRLSPISLPVARIATNGHARRRKCRDVFASTSVISKVEKGGDGEAFDACIEIKLEDRIQNPELGSELPCSGDYTEAIGKSGGTECE